LFRLSRGDRPAEGDSVETAVRPKRDALVQADVRSPYSRPPGSVRRYGDAITTRRHGADPLASLRVAVLAPIAWRTPPRHYGPWELFAGSLADGLVAAGHDVTLFATADSLTNASLHATSPAGWSDDRTIDPKVAECLHIASVFERADEFDIIHNGFDFLPLTYSDLVGTPVVTTIHGFSSPRIVRVYERYDATTDYVAISDADRHPRLNYAATIHHGIDTASFGVDPNPGDHLLFFGRIHPDKGTAHAIRLAQHAGRRLDIAGIIQDEAYFREAVEPHLDGAQIRYLGPIGAADRAAVLGGAHALVHLVDFDEPFGYSVVEAMACGTPVIAHRRGSMPELIDHGTTGFLVAGADEAVAAVTAAGGLDRVAIRNAAVARFDVTRMVADYVAVYESILGRSNPASPASL
jgi:glycosyltransferase involved in cell wall biosynthesis